MPRILPRLLDALAKAELKPLPPNRTPPDAFRRRKRVSLLKPLPPRPSFSPDGRTQSIVLDDVSPIAHPREFQRHKAQPPKTRLAYNQTERWRVKQGKEPEFDPPRLMTDEERKWYSNPYRACCAAGLHASLGPDETLI